MPKFGPHNPLLAAKTIVFSSRGRRHQDQWQGPASLHWFFDTNSPCFLFLTALLYRRRGRRYSLKKRCTLVCFFRNSAGLSAVCPHSAESTMPSPQLRARLFLPWHLSAPVRCFSKRRSFLASGRRCFSKRTCKQRRSSLHLAVRAPSSFLAVRKWRTIRNEAPYKKHCLRDDDDGEGLTYVPASSLYACEPHTHFY